MYLSLGAMLASWAREGSTEPVSRAVFSTATMLCTAAMTAHNAIATVHNSRLVKQDIQEATAALTNYVAASTRRAA